MTDRRDITTEQAGIAGRGFGRRGILALLVAAGLLGAGCGKLDIKPQDPGALTRGLKKSNEDDPTLWSRGGSSLLPENEFVTLPENSSPANWTKFSVKRFTEHSAALDISSISVGGDGITRYTLLIRSSQGVDNISHEGIRCSTQEWKMYATGRPNGGWARVPIPQWRRVDQTGLNAIRYTLFEDYVCDRDGATVPNAQVVLGRIKRSNDGLLSRRAYDGSSQ